MNPTPTQIAGQNVRAEMARQGVSQADLAAHMGISQTAVSKRLRGATPFDINELVAAAELLNVPLETITNQGVAA